eukprot:NODE_114_length_18474_cov_1.567510.p7 type:complete len:329 gc:universal NODE_114_length_18474_cov_1.567510:11239-12225(+)
MIANSLEEQNTLYYWKVYFSFKNYAKWYTRVFEDKINKAKCSKDAQYLKLYIAKCQKAIYCLHQNQSFFDDMLAGTPQFVEERKIAAPSPEDFDKCVSALKCIARDWSNYGKQERGAYDVVLQELKDIAAAKEMPQSVNCPGSGLSRLAYEIAKLGFNVKANELTYHMLIPCYFILNSIAKSYTIYPFIHNFQNRMKVDDCFEPIIFPDEFPELNVPNTNFSMNGGDFQEVCGVADITVSSYFIDTGKNALDYIRTIDLNTSSIWINIGPLLYHHETFELSWEEILKFVEQETNFKTKKSFRLSASYCADTNSIVQYSYNNIFCKFIK